VVDWTPVATAAIAAGSAVLGAGLGYFTALSQSKAELARLRFEHGEKHLEHRQGVYHNYLDTAHRFHQAMGKFEPFQTPEELQEWVRLHEHNATAVSLFGTEAAWKAVQRQERLTEQAMGDSDHYEDKYERDWLSAWDETIEAMRPDTAPNG
jgi:hypothetical protein